jgi:hypothetical protein
MRLIYLTVSILLSLTAEAIVGQNLQSFFNKDSVKIGEPVELTLYYEHASYAAVLLPDSAFNYYPFEYISRKYYPTRTREGLSADCTVYILRTFEPIEQLSLALPVRIFTETDTLILKHSPAQVQLKPMLTGNPDLDQLRIQVLFNPVPKQINYPMILLVTFASLFTIFILNAFFGKPIRRRFRIFTAIFAHRQFVKSFETLEKTYLSKKEVTTLEKILGHWKDYLTILEEKPVSSYTSTEIIAMYGKEDLKNSLQILDRAIFGRILSEEEDKALKTLKSFSNKRYISRKNEIRRS